MNKHHKDTCLKEIGPCFRTLITTLYSIVNTFGMIYVCSQGTHKHALLITMTKSPEIRFSIRISNMFHHIFAIVAQIFVV
jgi:hypothetical protein